jgi:hypothetical protein
MKKAILNVTFLMFVVSSFAQENLLLDGKPIFENTTKNWFVSLNGWSDHGSNAITNTFVNRFLFGGHISNEEKLKVAEGLENKNTFGADAGGNIALIYRRDEKPWAYQMGYGYTQIQRIDFEEAIFRLIFYGNAELGDETVRINSSESQSQGFHKAFFGLVDTKTGSSLRIGIYAGENFNQTELGNSTLRTSFESTQGFSYPSSIAIETAGFSETSGNMGSGLFSTGYGVGIDANINRKFGFGTVSLGVQDFGFMYWSDLEKRSSEGITTFDGFEIDFDGNGIQIGSSDSFTDSLFNIQTETRSQTELLPWRLSATYISKAEKDVFTSVHLVVRPSVFALPHFTFALNYKLKESSFVWISGSAGGPEIFGIGIGAQVNLLDNTFVTVSSKHVSGWIAPNGLARSLQFQIVQRI